MTNTVAQVAPNSSSPSYTPTLVCSCGHNGLRQGAHKKVCVRHLVRGFTVANDLVQEILPSSEVGPELPSDQRRVIDAMTRGWGRSLHRTLTYGLMRQGLSYVDAVALGIKAVKEHWIKLAKGGGWKLWSED